MSNRFSIAIATAGRPDLLRRTLQSLAACPKPTGYAETVVVENGPRGDVETVVADFKSILGARHLHVPQPNKSFALNVALETMGRGLIFFTDDDVWVEKDTLRAYDRVAGTTTTGRFFGGPTQVDYESQPPAWLTHYLPKSACPWQWQGDGDVVDGAVFLGFNWAAFADDLRQAGGFDPSRGPGTSSTGQETDMQRRLLAGGLQGVYVRDAMVRHFIPAARCTPQWAIERNYRHGMEKGRKSADERPAIAGYPLWIVRRWCQGLVRRGVTSVIGTSRARFVARHRQSYNRGMIEGVRLAAGSRSTPISPQPAGATGGVTS